MKKKLLLALVFTLAAAQPTSTDAMNRHNMPLLLGAAIAGASFLAGYLLAETEPQSDTVDTAIQSNDTNKHEITLELNDFLNKEKSLLRNSPTTYPVIKEFIDEIDDDNLLQNTTGWIDYAKKYVILRKIVHPLRTAGLKLYLITSKDTPKIHALIESVAKKMNMMQNLPIYLIDEELPNAFAAGLIPSLSIIGLDKKLFSEFPNIKAFEFLIAHELTHIKHKHVIKNNALSLCIVIASWELFSYILNEAILRTKSDTLITFCIKLLGVKISDALVGAWYSRLCETDADLTAAQAIGAEGGIDCLSMLENKFSYNADRDFDKLQEIIQQSSLNNNESFNSRVLQERKIAKAMEEPSFFDTHPVTDNRIQELSKSRNTITRWKLDQNEISTQEAQAFLAQFMTQDKK